MEIVFIFYWKIKVPSLSILHFPGDLPFSNCMLLQVRCYEGNKILVFTLNKKNNVLFYLILPHYQCCDMRELVEEEFSFLAYASWYSL